MPRLGLKALAEAKKRGVVRNIGVSNFDVKQLSELSALPEAADAPIAANQIQLSPFAPSFAFETARWCQEHGVAVVAHSPLAGAFFKAKAVTHKTIQSIAAKHDSLRSPTQVLLKWAIQKGYGVIPGSGNPEHQRSNLQIYDAELKLRGYGEARRPQGRRQLHVHGHAGGEGRGGAAGEGIKDEP